MVTLVAAYASTIDTAEKFLSLPSDLHRALVMPYCGISFRQNLLHDSNVPLTALNLHDRTVELEHGDMGVSTLAACDLRGDEVVFTVRGPLVSKANVYTVQVDQGHHMIFSGGAEFLAHSCQPNVKLVIEKLDDGQSFAKGFPIDSATADQCIPNLLGSVNFPDWWEGEKPACGELMFQSAYALRVVALRDIQKGEILSFNYLTTEYDMDEPFDCLCGGARDAEVEDGETLPKCFGTIKGYRHLPETYKRLLKPLCTPVVLRDAEQSIH
ncbi:hypothetical protein XU18_2592 [Perkinsela sp. CCAP 1560/4]|nr:hypothetical protein XU18_2592 [Perkinsela sp. CCAP 1560/4]|eukprot:KNH06571.1 hypothetical protein XU18_2592 [Perkinsela sp. CCAP 1560/4]